MLRCLLILSFCFFALPATAQLRVIDTRDEGGPWMHVVSEPELAFDHTTQSCFEDNYPDLPVRAARAENGFIRLFLTHYPGTTYMLWRPFDPAPAFDNFVPYCRKVLGSPRALAPEFFAFDQWLASVYSLDGITLHGLVHNEFKGHQVRIRGICPSGDYFSCWYNSITYVRSRDSGYTFGLGRRAPNHLVAMIPMQYVPDSGPIGVFSPSNIVERDGYYYAIFRVVAPFQREQHVCLMRTDNLDDPSSWRYWHPQGFDRAFANPYSTPLEVLVNAWCPALALSEIANMHESLVYHPVMDRYILIGTTSDPARDPNIHGFYYAFSQDLITWTRRRPLMEVPLPFTVDDPTDVSYAYPSLIDPDSPGFNFEFTDDGAYLYFTRFNEGQGSNDRDLLRVQVQISE